MEDIFYIYMTKQSRVPHEWYLSPRSRINSLIIGAPTSNKDLDRRVVAVPGKWEFSMLEPIGPLSSLAVMVR